MKPTTVLSKKRLELAGDGVGARLERLLIDAVMGVGRERAALAGLEVHDVVPDRAALAAPSAASRPSWRMREIDAEALIGGLGAGDRLEHQIDRRAAIDRLDAGGDMGQHAGLGRDLDSGG